MYYETLNIFHLSNAIHCVCVFQIADITPSQEIRLSPELLDSLMDANKVMVKDDIYKFSYIL